VLAAHKGFFTEEGVDVELIQVNPRLGATAVLNGDIDLTTTFGSTLRGILGGFPLKFVAVSVRKSEHFLIARPEFKDLRELKGKRLAVSTLFGSDQRAAEEILRAKGFSPGISNLWHSVKPGCARRLCDQGSSKPRRSLRRLI
jgi:ABC-type nitrate/sulfonate/bicarbonate transport system substrate-binding protein